MMRTVETGSAAETFNLGRQMGQAAKAGDIFALSGDLGTGKTVFTQGFAEGLGIKEPVTSPTFTILQLYEEGRLRGCTDESGQLSPEASAKVRAHSWQDSDALQVMQGVSAIVFPGGEDISPSLYAKPQAVQVWEGFSPERDVSDFLLMSLCLEKDVPVLALCRGCQVLSVVSGAEMIQDIPVYLESRGIRHAHEHRNEPPSPGAYRDFAFHDVRIVEKDSLLYRIVGREVIPKAPSWHHQAVGSVEGTPLRVTGVFEAPGTELIEAVERPDKAFVLGLQFHPEIAVVRGLDETSILYFRAIVEAADGR